MSVDSENHPINKFTEEQVDEFENAFKLFDKNNDGLINMKEFITIMRSFAQTQYEMELEGIFKKSDVENTGVIDFAQFMNILEHNYDEDNTPEGISNAFRAFDPLNKGIILADDLRDYMMTYGDRLTEEEACEFIKQADTSKDGRIMYESFVNKMAHVVEKKQKYIPRIKVPSKTKQSKSKLQI